MVSHGSAAAMGAFAIVVLITLLFLRLFHEKRKAEQQEAAAAEEEAGGDEEGQQQPPAEQAAGPPLVCRYRRADGWRERSCGVCLSELADGEIIRVLPACMHYFHAACVGEWLSAHHTCPLCRAPLAAADTT
ncbi:unnamed protein product [Urochloa decumbens]|uniref:RING-type domain-containing protein n=1 Tax=Urochloa decumbens TaxID=240449 RepID=A0ABC9ATZ3_9POAL